MAAEQTFNVLLSIPDSGAPTNGYIPSEEVNICSIGPVGFLGHNYFHTCKFFAWFFTCKYVELLVVLHHTA